MAPIVGAAVGAYGANQSAKAANAGSKGAGQVDITTYDEPWGPSERYREALMRQASELFGVPVQQPPAPNVNPYGQPGGVRSGEPPDPSRRPGPGPVTGQRRRGAPAVPPGGTVRPDGRIIDARGRTIYTPPAAGGKGGKGGKGAGKGGGVGAGAPAPPKFEGVSPETNLIRDRAIREAEAGSPLYEQAERYIGDTLAGKTTNPYFEETAQSLRGLDDPDLRRFKEMLFGELSGGSPQRGGFGGEVRRGNSNPAGAAAALAAQRGGSPGGPVDAWGAPVGSPPGAAVPGGAGPVGVVDDLQAIIAGKYLDQQNPYFKSLLDKTKTDADAALNERLQQNALRAVGSGMYGATPWQNIEAESLSDYGVGLGQALGGLSAQEYENRMADLMSAVETGAGYDLASLDRVSRERMSAEDRAAAERMSGASSSAAAGAAAADIASREKLAKLGILSDLTGMGVQQGQFRAQGFGGLADLFSGDQRFALGATPDITGLSLRDWGAAGGLSLGADELRSGFLADRGRERVGMAGVGLGRSELEFDKYRYNREAPFNDIARFADIINSASGGAGQSRETGFDRRSQSPSRVSPWGQAAAGGLAGWAYGSQIQGQRSGAPPTTGSTTNLGPIGRGFR